jgi:hypothetical protein
VKRKLKLRICKSRRWGLQPPAPRATTGLLPGSVRWESADPLMKESPSEDSISSTVDQANRTYTMWSTLAWSRFRNYIHKLMFTMKRWSENEGGGKKNGYSLRRSTSICGSVLRLAGRFPEPCKCAHKHGTPHSPTDLPPEYSWPRDSRACKTDFTEGISTTTVQWLVGGSRRFHLPKNWKVMCDSNIASHGQMLAWHNIF